MDDFATRPDPHTVAFVRILPGPIERIWDFIADGKKRGEWFASGDLPEKVGQPFTMRFKHSTLSPNQAPPPEPYKKMDAEGHQAEETVTEIDPPRRLAFTWGGNSEVVFELTPKDGKVLLTLTHRKLASEAERNGNAAGWQCHLAVLVDKVEGRTPPAFWDIFSKVSAEYANGIPR